MALQSESLEKILGYGMRSLTRYKQPALFGRKENKKRGDRRTTSRRYDLLPLLPSGPDGVHRELAA